MASASIVPKSVSASWKGFEYLGVDFDFELNKHPADAHVSVLSKPDSKVKVAIIPTNEELVIARETKELTQNLVK